MTSFDTLTLGQLDGLSLSALDGLPLYLPVSWTAWSPLDLGAKLEAWYTADAVYITEAGGLVSQWNDRSGNGNHATASGAARPTFSATAIDSASPGVVLAPAAVMTTPNLTVKEAVAVFQLTGTDIMALVSQATSPIVWEVFVRNTQVSFDGSSTEQGAYSTAGGALSSNATNHTVSLSAGAGNSLLGTFVWNNTATTNRILNRSATLANSGGTLVHMVLVNDTLTTEERQLLEGYLAWQTPTISLDAGHPYVAFDPSVSYSNIIPKRRRHTRRPRCPRLFRP